MAIGIPRTQLKQRHVKSPPSQYFEKSFVLTYDRVQQEFVIAHNVFRATVGSPPLQWDGTLANFSRGWALERKNDCNYKVHSDNKTYGENIFWQQYKESTPMQVVRSWFNENQFYDHKRHTCKCKPERDTCECGHYTNLIWKTTKKVGCSGFVYCNDQRGVYVVCSYYGT
ncbi:hypothetical protein DM860_001153 [Cuscuta australis]|uniref:SCP domain-containing protein n=1 Tax=Cuscuta australis TaxID=267555 RepID=A0A328DXK2_9ASTE|nr:hypothetical protein DM860_001153 [Cuscuta australis]